MFGFKFLKGFNFIVITKKQIITALSVILALIIITVGSEFVFAGNERKLPIYSVDTDKKKIAISFDAAWGNDDTSTLIKILKKYDVPATFFVVGAWVDKYPESVREISNAGHQIQNHSNTHPYMTKISKEKMIDEIKTCNEKIKSVTGVCPTLLRVPYGDYDNCVIETALECKMFPVQWSIDSIDWRDDATPESICNRVISKAHNGGIILMHNDAKYTPAALPEILETLKKDGYEFVLISDLIYKDNYTIDHTGKQCKYK